MRCFALFGLLVIGATGCGRAQPVLSGAVTINGQPVANGFVTFFPVEGTKSACGAEVKDGQYAVKDIRPGQWRAQVTQMPDVEDATRTGGPPLLRLRGGANATLSCTPKSMVVEVRQGKQSLDLAYECPTN